MSTENPTDVRARYAGRLAHQYRAVWRSWQTDKSPELAAVLAGLARAREDHLEHTGWFANYDGHTTTYHYTDPAERPQL